MTCGGWQGLQAQGANAVQYLKLWQSQVQLKYGIIVICICYKGLTQIITKRQCSLWGVSEPGVVARQTAKHVNRSQIATLVYCCGMNSMTGCSLLLAVERGVGVSPMQQCT